MNVVTVQVPYMVADEAEVQMTPRRLRSHQMTIVKIIQQLGKQITLEAPRRFGTTTILQELAMQARGIYIDAFNGLSATYGDQQAVFVDNMNEGLPLSTKLLQKYTDLDCCVVSYMQPITPPSGWLVKCEYSPETIPDPR
jgi:hypothetical protein